MRTLKFIVDDQIIKQDPNCDFTNLVPGTDGYLQAHFSFSSAWDGCVKVAAFSSALGTEYNPQILKDGKTCVIPSEALKKQIFKVRVIGKKDGCKINTNYVIVNQDGGTNE
jgi:hypothetical protein